MTWFRWQSVHVRLKDGSPEDVVHLLLEALQDLRRMKMIHTPGLQVMKMIRPNKYILKSFFGSDFIEVLYEPKEKPIILLPEKIQLEPVIWPVLGILLTPKDKIEDYTGDIYPMTTNPNTDGGWLYMDKDSDQLLFPNPALEGSNPFWNRHYRLDHIGQDDNQYDESPDVEVYTPADDNVILEHEFAYRTIWDPFGRHWVNVDPVIFTCGDYEPVTTTEIEFYTEKDRAVDWHTISQYSVTADDNAVASGTFDTHHPYDLEFVDTITIPDDLPGDGWSAEQIARCCYAPGEYEIWKRTVKSATYNGTQVYHELGEGSDAVKGYTLGQHSACLYSKYVYSSNAYRYQLILWVNGDEHVICEGSRAASGYTDIPDDVYITDFKMFDFLGKPVIVFGYAHYWWTQDNIIQYGIWYSNELYLTKEFLNYTWPSPNWNRHSTQELHEQDSDEEILEGYGEVSAFGISRESQVLALTR